MWCMASPLSPLKDNPQWISGVIHDTPMASWLPTHWERSSLENHWNGKQSHEAAMKRMVLILSFHSSYPMFVGWIPHVCWMKAPSPWWFHHPTECPKTNVFFLNVPPERIKQIRVMKSKSKSQKIGKRDTVLSFSGDLNPALRHLFRRAMATSWRFVPCSVKSKAFSEGNLGMGWG